MHVDRNTTTKLDFLTPWVYGGRAAHPYGEPPKRLVSPHLGEQAPGHEPLLVLRLNSPQNDVVGKVSVGATISIGGVVPTISALTEAVRSMILRPIEATMHRIREFTELQPGWDGRGGYPVTNVAVSEADLLLALSLALPSYHAGVKVDAVPTPAGGILIEWRGQTSRLQAEVHKDGLLSGLSADLVEGKSRNRVSLHSLSRDDVLERVREMK